MNGVVTVVATCIEQRDPVGVFLAVAQLQLLQLLLGVLITPCGIERNRLHHQTVLGIGFPIRLRDGLCRLVSCQQRNHQCTVVIGK